MATTSNNSWLTTRRRIGIYAAILLAVFLLGLVPMWLTARERTEERDQAAANLRVSQLQNRLATAALNARRGEYEAARIAASDFFTDLRREIDRTDSALNQNQRNTLQPILTERDNTITLLARNDPAALERLTELYFLYQQTANPVAPQSA